ncbi:MAG: hypothetical protein NTV54_11865 [Ignavibacteriales bacterium]|nr:hypothetical protein [Ignavibacteriales bacterium]
MKKQYYYVAAAIVVLAAVAVYIFWKPGLSDRIVIPYIAHQPPIVDPHLPNATPLSDKLDELQFDGLFNVVAGPSGIVYEDGLGELVSIDSVTNTITVRLKGAKRWHDSYQATADGDKVTIAKTGDHFFTPRDLAFTLKRLQALGSLSPDYILVAQAVPTMTFAGPDAQNEIRFQFRGDRVWKETDVKEVLSFKIIPENADLKSASLRNGSGAYLALPAANGVSSYWKSPDGNANISRVSLSPFVDNSTFTTEFRNGNINVLLETPFGCITPILQDQQKFFCKSNISTTFFGLLMNTQRLSREQRNALRQMIDTKAVVDRFFKVSTGQQRHIIDYKGNYDNYSNYLNRSIFPSSSYYVEEGIVTPVPNDAAPHLSVLPDTVRIKACVNFGFREEYSELIEILNDPAVTHGKVRATAVQNDDIKAGNYDAVLIAFTGYRSNFLFDMYDIFFREPDFSLYKINLGVAGSGAEPQAFQMDRNFFRLDSQNPSEGGDVQQLLKYVYGFMATSQIGDKQAYAQKTASLESDMALGVWLFSLPSLAYFNRQFDSASVDMYGVASQLSTAKKWKELPQK